MTAGALTALKQLGIVPGKDIQLIGSGGTNQFIADIKAGTVFGTVALYPCTESYIGIKDLVAALQGKKVPGIVDVTATKNYPWVVDAATLKSTPGFKPDWNLTGTPG
jgi:ABC-type sugar transport system substrate-binding protein